MAARAKEIRARKERDGREEVLVASNRRARHDYEILATEEAGLVLTGTEVKALRQGRASLTDGGQHRRGR